MSNNNSSKVIINDRINHVIEELQGSCGMARMYCDCIARLRKMVLFLSDDLGMSDNEALDTIRILEFLHADLRVLSGQEITPAEDPADMSGPSVPENFPSASQEEVRRNLDRMAAGFSAGEASETGGDGKGEGPEEGDGDPHGPDDVKAGKS